MGYPCCCRVLGSAPLGYPRRRRPPLYCERRVTRWVTDKGAWRMLDFRWLVQSGTRPAGFRQSPDQHVPAPPAPRCEAQSRGANHLPAAGREDAAYCIAAKHRKTSDLIHFSATRCWRRLRDQVPLLGLLRRVPGETNAVATGFPSRPEFHPKAAETSNGPNSRTNLPCRCA